MAQHFYRFLLFVVFLIVAPIYKAREANARSETEFNPFPSLNVSSKNNNAALRLAAGTSLPSNNGKLVITGQHCYGDADWIEVYARKGARCGKEEKDALQYEDIPDYHICFNSETLTSYYSRSVIIGFESFPTNATERSVFSKAKEIFHFDFDEAYKQKSMMADLKLLLGEDSFRTHFPLKKGLIDNKFSKGHLYPRNDAFTFESKEATMFYINAPPQWERGNNVNWNLMEEALQKHAVTVGRAIIVWTGTFGRLQFPNEQGVLTEIYIKPPPNKARNDKKLYVPKFFWKAIYNHFTGESVAIVQVNNPFTDPNTEERLCPRTQTDLCDTIPWLNAALPANLRERPTEGYIYCCSLDELRKTVSYAPHPEEDPDI